MAKRSAARALGALTRTFTAPEFLARTELSREGALALLETGDWPRELEARRPAARRRWKISALTERRNYAIIFPAPDSATLV